MNPFITLCVPHPDSVVAMTEQPPKTNNVCIRVSQQSCPIESEFSLCRREKKKKTLPETEEIKPDRTRETGRVCSGEDESDRRAGVLEIGREEAGSSICNVSYLITRRGRCRRAPDPLTATAPAVWPGCLLTTADAAPVAQLPMADTA